MISLINILKHDLEIDTVNVLSVIMSSLENLWYSDLHLRHC